MSHHVMVRLPDGRRAVAHADDPIVPVMREIHQDYAKVADWLDANEAQVRSCESYLYGGSDAEACVHHT